MKRLAAWPGAIVASTNLLVACAWVFGGMVGVLYAAPLSIAGLAALGFGLWKKREPLLLLGAPLLVFPLGIWGMLLNQCARGNCL
ncbi:MAG: hypothetical protein P0Y56_09215 [Candidatus Andeanibacterium colombiense]|uniref:Uncharacterized protein n=1 Tax=Candidatus Andeanibacterium colombiense TaxID=3121345 RepID=A0AAJ5X327_9SPHN|nr:MAG: hypothetical protein P0Y56_09215 [Sphingomonadaceae bacterium]